MWSGIRQGLFVAFSLLLLSASAPLFAQQRNLDVGKAEGAPNEQRVALVIGNSAYKEAPLRNPVNDATDMAAALRALGFEVTLRTDANTRQMRAAIREFAQNLKKSGVGLFYFAGHGVQSKSGRNYLIPVGSDLKEEYELEDEAVDANRVLGGMEEAGNRVNIVILDACRNNPFARSWRSAANGLAQMNAPAGSFVGFATAPGSVAADGSGRNGIYTKHLLANLKAGDPDIDRVFTRVAAEVSRETGKKQVPWKSSSLTGEFAFRTLAVAPSSAPIVAVPAGPAGGQFSVEDLQKQQESRAQWDRWQRQMKADFDKTAALKLAPELQAAAWGRFISSYVEDNPYSADAAGLRAEAQNKKQQAEAEDARQKEETAQKRRAAQQLALAPASVAATRPAAAPGSIAGMSPGASFRDCDVCPEMVVIPAGNFTMGSPASEAQRDSDEGPQHEVRIARAFAAGKYEVTFDEWDACVRESGCSHNPSDQRWGRGRRPVINVSWNDAKQYTEWLSRKTGKSYRLLSEAQWEYAARAGTTTAFSFGNSITPQQANYNSKVSYAPVSTADNQGQTVPVGSYPANAFGLHEVHGNVWEWTEDCWNGNYNGAPADGSAWTSGDCGPRVLRGGSWRGNPRHLHSAVRNGLDPTIRDNNFGLRVSRTN